MKIYHMNMQQIFNEKYQIFFQQAKNWGWFSTDTYIKALLMKDHGKMTIVEKLMYQDIKEIDQIYEEIVMIEQSEDPESEEIVAPFPLKGKFKEHFIATVKHARKFRTVKFTDTIFCPHALPEETFTDRLRKSGFDVEGEIQKCKI
jgi:hypothetical protein